MVVAPRSEGDVEARQERAHRRLAQELERAEVRLATTQNFRIKALVFRPRTKVAATQRQADSLGTDRRRPLLRRKDRHRHLAELPEPGILDVATIRSEEGGPDRGRLIRERGLRIVQTRADPEAAAELLGAVVLLVAEPPVHQAVDPDAAAAEVQRRAQCGAMRGEGRTEVLLGPERDLVRPEDAVMIRIRVHDRLQVVRPERESFLMTLGGATETEDDRLDALTQLDQPVAIAPTGRRKIERDLAAVDDARVEGDLHALVAHAAQVFELRVGLAHRRSDRAGDQGVMRFLSVERERQRAAVAEQTGIETELD